MDHFFRQQESDKQQSKGLLASLQIFDDILKWLAGFIQLTEEEQIEAGIYLGYRHDK